MPELLMDLDNCFSLRMRAPLTGSVDIATYYMSNYTCEYCRALLERGIEGGFNFLSAIMAVDACAEMNRSMENIEVQKLIPGEGFFLTHVDVPYKLSDYGLEHYVQQLRDKVLAPLHEKYGVDVSEASLRRAAGLHNEVCRLVSAMGELRKEERPRITGYEFHVLNLVTYCCPKYLVVERLRETLEELESREPDAKRAFRARVVLVGSELDDPEFTKLIEESGALVVADRYCFGSLPGRQELDLEGGRDLLSGICRQYLESSQCPRFMSHEKIDARRELVAGYARDYRADGVIYEQIKFCDFWGFERPLAAHILDEDYGLPVLSLDRPYMARSSGQLRTRIQAFVESLEIKRIQKGEAIRG
jgi:benzoyl-CoA reductase/2-hydroxyglutaryl-CoA dehydratase subunit BcrC/BadD/HgdB